MNSAVGVSDCRSRAVHKRLFGPLVCDPRGKVLPRVWRFYRCSADLGVAVAEQQNDSEARTVPIQAKQSMPDLLPRGRAQPNFQQPLRSSL